MKLILMLLVVLSLASLEHHMGPFIIADMQLEIGEQSYSFVLTSAFLFTVCWVTTLIVVAVDPAIYLCSRKS